MALILMAAFTNYRRDPRVRREAEALVDAGHRVVFLASAQAGEPRKETLAGVEVIKAWGPAHDRTSKSGYLIGYSLFFMSLLAHLLRHPLRYRLIHVNNMPDFLVFATVLPRLLGRPVIHDVHDLMPEIFAEKFRVGPTHWLVRTIALQERWAGKYATAVLTVEDRLKDILAGRGIPRERIHVLLNLPDDRIFLPRPAPVPRPSQQRFVVVYHGTLAHRLGLDIAIDAVSQIIREIPELELRIIGAGEERDSLIAQRDALDLQAQVTFSEGFVPVERIPSMIEDADVGLIPLRSTGGTDIMLPTKLLEYVAVGIPCVCPRTPTISRYFDEKMVEFFKAGDSASLADALRSLHRNPARRQALSQQATERFGRVYCWKEHRKLYVDLVARLVQEP